jgi:hypothetical protein
MLTMSRRPHLGIFVPLAVVAILVASVVAAGAASASRIAPRQHNGVQGIVTSVNGTSTPAGTTCGVASASGVFTLVGMRHGIVAIDVTVGTTATAFTDAALTTPTFANVCVGSRVIALGTLASGTLTATSVTVIPAQAQGIVASVNGISTPAGTTCGVAGASGTLTLTGGMRRQAVTTVDITGGTTTFRDAALTAPTFANVCVGSRVIALGTLSAGTLTATLVTIVPAQAQGIVTAMTVAGLTATCGSSGDSGTLTLGGMRPIPVFANALGLVTTVDITGGTTTFTDPALTPPSSANFTNVCVGSRVIALGTLSAGTLTATLVTIVPPPPARVEGIVASVNGASTPAGTTCGVANTSGVFTLASTMRQGITSVVVTAGTPATTFTDQAVVSPTTPSFADVCVGSHVMAIGAMSAGTLTATSVTVVPLFNLSGGHRNRRGPGAG